MRRLASAHTRQNGRTKGKVLIKENTMIRYYSEDECVLDGNGNPISKKEKEFLNLMNKLQEEYGSGMILAIQTIFEALIKKGK